MLTADFWQQFPHRDECFGSGPFACLGSGPFARLFPAPEDSFCIFAFGFDTYFVCLDLRGT